jgi:hypothetical protein
VTKTKYTDEPTGEKTLLVSVPSEPEAEFFSGAKQKSESFGKSNPGIGKGASNMKRTAFLLILILALMHQTSSASDNSEFPKWVHKLRLVAVKTFQTEVNVSHVKLSDNVEEGKYFPFQLYGKGSLRIIEDPFERMERMFSSRNWIYIPRYQADGHGSSSFAYQKGNRLCNIHITTDSSCDDEEMGHIPSEFRFEIYCRDE